MKRILLLIKGLGRGGAEQLLVNAAPYVDTSRFEYEVAYLLPWKDALVGELEESGLRVTCLEGVRGPGWIGRLRTLVRERGIDLVHAHSPVVAAGARMALRRPTPAFVYTEHNVWERYRQPTRWANLLTYPRNDHVFAVSEHVRSSIRYPGPGGRLPLPPLETLYHGPNPVAEKEWVSADGVREEFGIPAGEPIVGTVANFKPHKGYEHLLRAAVRVRAKVPGVHFILVGQGPLEESVREEARALGLDGSMIFAGYREDVPRVSRAFDVFVLASLHEGLSIALIEAMALGKPPVVTSAGGLPEVVDDGRNGIVVPPGDPVALAGALVRILNDAELRDRLGNSAIVRARKFDIRDAVARMEQVYSELLR